MQRYEVLSWNRKIQNINFPLLGSEFFSTERTGCVIYIADMCAEADKTCTLISAGFYILGCYCAHAGQTCRQLRRDGLLPSLIKAEWPCLQAECLIKFLFLGQETPTTLIWAILISWPVKFNQLDDPTRSRWTPPPPPPYLFNGAVGERMCGHVKQQEVLFLCGEDTFLYQVFRQTLSNVSELVVQLQGIPGLSWRTTWDPFQDMKHTHWQKVNVISTL